MNKLKFCIRDDDICYHTNANELQKLYKDIIEICPISFSCIPYVGGFDIDQFDAEMLTLYDNHWKSWITSEIYPIDGNKKLVKLLKHWLNSKKAIVMLHGINHRLNEFTEERDFVTDIKLAKSYLEKTFSTKLEVASPPNNSLMPSATLGLSENKFNILTSFGHLPKERPLSFRNIFNFILLLSYYGKYKRKFRVRKPLNFGTHFEQPCYGIGPNITFKELKDGLNFSLKRGGNFVVATHYYHMLENNDLNKMLKDIVDYAQNQKICEVEFVSADKLFKVK
jgi:hypothetical protein